MRSSDRDAPSDGTGRPLADAAGKAEIGRARRVCATEGDEAAALAALQPSMESTYLKLEHVGTALIGRLKCEKLAERESNVMNTEIAGHAQESSWKVALDLEEVMLVASVGLGALVTLNKNCKANNGKLVVFNMAEEILESLKLSRLDRIITIVADQAAALKALA